MEDNLHDWRSDRDVGAPDRIPASPLARRLARERGIDLSDLTGSGPGGRIVEADVPGGEDTVAHAALGGMNAVSTTRGSAARTGGSGRQREAAARGIAAPLAADGAASEAGQRVTKPDAAARTEGNRKIRPDQAAQVEAGAGQPRQGSEGGIATARWQPAPEEGTAILRRSVPAARLECLRGLLEDAYGPLGPGVFLARAVSRAEGLPVGYAISDGAVAAAGDGADLVTLRDATPGGATPEIVIRDVSSLGLASADLPLSAGASLQLVTGAIRDDGAEPTLDLVATARVADWPLARTADLLDAVAEALARPATLLAGLPETVADT
ncbi:E3 binding domain-containing protein [Roseivivax marinus]|uniref:E3 binding domain-containing protein n=1 Tax=Roseivivax marinus TaxID=1379903 RepID=UPI003B97C8E0